MQYDLFTLGADNVANDRVALEKEEENSEEFDDDGLCFQAVYGRQPSNNKVNCVSFLNFQSLENISVCYSV
jgi:hypothetical protein